MNRNQLRYFVSAAEHRSFTKAAEQYYISQTAVTQQIQQLEQTLGCELFDRSTRPVSLTSAGKSFLLDAKAILERMSRAQERVHDAATGLTGTLRVGYVRGYERSDLSVLMRHFHQKNGNVLISFYRCSTDVLAAGLLHQEYDIVFTWDSTNLRTQEGVTFQTVEKARLVVALYAGHPLTQRRQLTRQELRGENILYMRFLRRRLFHAALRRGGLQAEHSLPLGGHRKHPDDGRGGGGDLAPARLLHRPPLQCRQPRLRPARGRRGGGRDHRRLAERQPEPRTGTVFDRAQSKRPALLRRVFLAQDRVKRWKIFLYRDRQTFCIEKAVDGCRVAAKAFEELRILFFAGEVLAEITFHFIENGAGRRVNRQNRTVFIKRSLIYHEEGVDASRFICYAYQ